MAAAIPVVMGAGLLLQAYSQYKANEANEEQARRNAEIAGKAADLALQEGEQKAGQIRERGEQVASRQRVAYAHAGVDVAVGTPARVISTTAMMTELDAQVTRNNAWRRAWGYRTQSGAFSEQAESYELEKWLSPAGSLLGGAAQFAGAVQNYW